MKVYKIKVNGKSYRVELESIEQVDSETKTEVKVAEKTTEVKKTVSGEGTPVLAPIQGGVVNVKVSVGSQVKKGDVLVIIEAMKLENEVPATAEGIVKEIKVNNGDSVNNNDVLIVLG